RPDDAVLGEEGTDRAGSTGLTWVVDPLDGTTNFLYRYPQWAVSVCCEDGDGQLVGCVHDPNRGETFSALGGGGAALDGVPIHVSTLGELDRALVGTGFNYDRAVRAGQAAALGTVLPAVRDVRRGGSAALDLAWTACGRLDGFWEAGLQRWDWAAGVLLVREAGGVVTAGPTAHGPVGHVAAGLALAEALAALVG
ncbi:MAG: Inositol-1-monophosphatase, partial [uncultured Thermoleophilia bacterium]